MRTAPPPGFPDMITFDAYHIDGTTPEFKGWQGFLSRFQPLKKSKKGNRRRNEIIALGITYNTDFNILQQLLWEVGPRPSLCHTIEMVNPLLKRYDYGNIAWMTSAERKARKRAALEHPEWFGFVGKNTEIPYFLQDHTECAATKLMEPYITKYVERRERTLSREV